MIQYMKNHMLKSQKQQQQTEIQKKIEKNKFKNNNDDNKEKYNNWIMILVEIVKMKKLLKKGKIKTIEKFTIIIIIWIPVE